MLSIGNIYVMSAHEQDNVPDRLHCELAMESISVFSPIPAKDLFLDALHLLREAVNETQSTHIRSIDTIPALFFMGRIP